MLRGVSLLNYTKNDIIFNMFIEKMRLSVKKNNNKNVERLYFT